MSVEKSEEFQIGVMVKAIQGAIARPEAEESLGIVVRYGTDSRYYVMIRGWLVQELQGVESQLSATDDEKRGMTFKAKVDFLRKAIRRIDLE